MLGLFILVSLMGLLIVSHVYGLVLCFKKSVLYGCLGLVVPGLATILGLVALIGRRNLLEKL